MATEPLEQQAQAPAAERVTGLGLLRARLPGLPDGPGVYRMIGEKGTLLYVGKARNLKRRVASYLRVGGENNRIARMLSEASDLEIVTTRSETEALLLEANLIKRLKPRYNIVLRDDKSYPYILVRGDHAFPAIVKYRGAQDKKGHYFGPFASAGAVDHTLTTLERAFLLRSCSDGVFETRTRPCLLHQIKRCSAPCVGLIGEAHYKALVEEAVAFLSGKSREVHAELTRAMEAASARLDFEAAALLRDRVRALSHIQARQDINPAHVVEADVIAAAAQGGLTCIEVFFFRSGQNWGNRAFFPRHEKGHGEAEVLEAFLAQYYDDKPVPKRLLLSHLPQARALIEAALSARAGHAVKIEVPKKGERRALVQHALDNAREALARRLSEGQSQRQLLEAVAELFSLAAAPERIEIYDNSHIQGAEPVGAMVVATADGFDKSQYRRFNIKRAELTPGDDYAMLRQVLTRRFSRLIKEEAGNGEKARPDLLLIDGGQGQLTVAREALADLGVGEIPVVAIAKGPDRDAGRERFFQADRPSFLLDPKSPVLYYLQRLRDEAHRFAIGGHRARRTRSLKVSALDEIPGIGPSRKRALLHHFGSARDVGAASLADLQAVPGISKAMAQRILDHFRSTRS
jgi:excinuclease ABC subunit C